MAYRYDSFRIGDYIKPVEMEIVSVVSANLGTRPEATDGVMGKSRGEGIWRERMVLILGRSRIVSRQLLETFY